MTPDDFYTPDRLSGPSRVPQHGEPLFEFRHGLDRYQCELRDHSEPYGVEAQFWKNEEFVYSRRFDARLDRTPTPRELAIAVAEEERTGIEAE